MNKQNFTLSDIRSSYPERKRNEDLRNNLWVYCIVRRVSFYFTWPFLRLNISANQITLISVLIAFAGLVFFALGSKLFLGALLLNIWLVLDCVDGNIVRCRKSANDYGKFIDSLSSYLIHALLFTSIGIGVSRSSDKALPFLNSLFSQVFHLSGIDRNIFLFLGIWASLCFVLTRLISQRLINVFPRAVDPDSGINGNKKNVLSVALVFGKNTVNSLIMPILLIAALFDLMSLVVIIYALLNTAALFLAILSSLLRAKKLSMQE